MLDTHAVARSLTDAEFTPAQADAITNTVRLAAEHGNHFLFSYFQAFDSNQPCSAVKANSAARSARLSRSPIPSLAFATS